MVFSAFFCLLTYTGNKNPNPSVVSDLRYNITVN